MSHSLPVPADRTVIRMSVKGIVVGITMPTEEGRKILQPFVEYLNSLSQSWTFEKLTEYDGVFLQIAREVDDV